MKITRFLALLALLLVSVAASANSLTIQGRIMRPDGNPVMATAVQFQVQIRSPGAERV